MRRFGQLDALIRGFVAKLPPPHKAGPAIEIMLMGACELVFLDVAPHAAVDGANRLAQADSKAVHFKPLINAVLRRVAREGKEAIAGQDRAAAQYARLAMGALERRLRRTGAATSRSRI